MAVVRNLFTIFDFPKSDWRRLQRTDFVRSGVETISTPRRTKFIRRDQWFYVISHLHNNRSYGRFERTIKWRSAFTRRLTLRLQLIIYMLLNTPNGDKIWIIKQKFGESHIIFYKLYSVSNLGKKEHTKKKTCSRK